MPGPVQAKKTDTAPRRPSTSTTRPSATANSRSTASNRGSASTSPSKSAASTRTDSFVKGPQETPSANPEKFNSFLTRFQEGVGQLGASTKPLNFSEDEKEAGHQAAGTMQRLAGQDSTWSKDDLANNLAQLQTPSGFKGSVARRVAQGGLFKAHNVPEEERAGIIERSQRVREENPDIAKLHKLESTDLSRISDPEQRAKYEELKSRMTSELGEKGLLPVGLDDLRQMGSASDALKEKLQEAGLPVKDGQPVNVDQYRGLFEGKSPLRTQLGF